MSFILNRLPYHKMYVELLSGDKSNLMRKIPNFSELYNDERGLLFDFFKILRDDKESFKEFIVNGNESFISNNKIVSIERWKELRNFYIDFNNEVIEGNLGRCTGYREVTPEIVRYLEDIDEGLHYMVERLRLVQYESRPFDDIIKRFDKPDTLFYIDVSRLDDLGVTPKDLCFHLLRVRGKCIIYGVCNSDDYEVLIDEGWIEVLDDKTQEVCWLNYRV